MKQPRRRTSSSAPKKTHRQATPEQIRSYAEEMYQLRQAAWHVQLLEDAPDWDHLMNLHLQMSELEHIADQLKSLP